NQKQKSPPSKGRTDCRGSTLLRHRYPQTAIPFPPVSSWRITGASGCRYLPEGLSRFHDSDSQTVSTDCVGRRSQQPALSGTVKSVPLFCSSSLIFGIDSRPFDSYLSIHLLIKCVNVHQYY